MATVSFQRSGWQGTLNYSRPLACSRGRPSVIFTYNRSSSCNLILSKAQKKWWKLREIDPEEERDQAKEALTDLFNEAKTQNTHIIVERIMADIDDNVKKVRFPDWQRTSQGECLVQKSLRDVLYLKYKLKDQDLFDKTYADSRQYYLDTRITQIVACISDVSYCWSIWMPTNKNPLADDLISLAEAADLYGLSVSYLRTIAENGRLEARKIGRNWVTTPKAVKTYLKSRTEKGAFRKDISP